MIRRVAILAAAVVFVAALPTRPSSAAITEPAKRIVRRYVESRGGSAAFDTTRTVRRKGRITGAGLRGTIETWGEAPDGFVTRLDLGAVKIRTGCAGAVAWRTDLHSRKVTVLDGKDLEEARSEAWFENEQWTRPDQGGGRVTAGSRAFGPGGDRDVLDITPPVGPPRRLWFDSKTGRIERIVVTQDQHQSEERVAAHRAIHGRSWPVAFESGDPGAPGGVATTRIDSLWVNSAIDPAVFQPPASVEPAVKWLSRAGVATLPFRYGSRHVWIPVSINGAPPADFLLDTGASVTVIDRSYARQIGLPLEGEFGVQGMGGTGRASFGRVKRLRVAGADGDGVELRDMKVGVIEFGAGMQPVMWRKVAGLLGADFLQRFVTRIDYDARAVTFHEPRGWRYEGSGEGIPFRLMGGIPIVRVEVGGACGGEFLVDVGNSFHMNLHGSLLRKCRLFELGRKEITVWGGGIAGTFQSTVCRLERARIGSFEWEEPIAALSLGTRGMVGSKDYAGNLGNGVLERFTCTFDYERRMLYREPGKKSAARVSYSRVGTLFLREGEIVRAAGITRGSPADQAGLQPNDEVLSIDGRPARRWTREEIDHLLEEGRAGSTHKLRIRRDGEESTLTLTLAEVL